jgi:low temperature requirement protein LtrA
MASPPRHLRPRGDGAIQAVTSVELFFDLVYVFAVTQLSHLIVDDLSVRGVANACFLLIVVWWAWIYTTWMANWFDPASAQVRGALTAVMLASLLMTAALPEALGTQGLLFAGPYIALQVGRNAVAASLLDRGHPLREVFGRLLVWSSVAGVLWVGGALLDADQRLLLWVPALGLELAAPAAGYWLPRRGRARTSDYDIEGGHFAERCQLFIIIALGESIVLTGATASAAGLSPTVLLGLAVSFAETAALWWVYFGATAEHARVTMSTCEDPGRLARDAYTYGHLPIIAGIIATAVGVDLLIAEPAHALHGVGLAMVLGGPALYLVGESVFRRRMTGKLNVAGLVSAGALLALASIGTHVSALVLSLIVGGLLALLAMSEREGRGPILPSHEDAGASVAAAVGRSA